MSIGRLHEVMKNMTFVMERCASRATTHTDLQLRARDLDIPVRIIHNASILNAVGACGLQLYRYGEVRRTSISFACPE